MITRARKFFNRYYSLKKQIEKLESHPKIDCDDETEETINQKVNKLLAALYIKTSNEIKNSATILTKSNNHWLYIPNQYNSNLSIKQGLNNLERKTKYLLNN